MSDNPPVLIHEHGVAGGLRVGHAVLNVEATLNSLSLEMIRLLDAALQGWAEREDICAVVITAAGDKAFCAGGDIQALYHAISANHEAGSVVDDYPFRFFEEEYRLDFRIHTFPKPVLTLGHGIVMGGGLGVLGASRFRVLTERSRLAVPEITIGLFPDAGASWTLRNMQPNHAAVLGLTGGHVNAADGLVTGMGTHVVAHGEREEFLQRCLDLTWQGEREADATMLAAWLDASPAPELPASELAAVPDLDLDYEDLPAAVAAVTALAERSEWLGRGVNNLTHGCPATAGIVLEQLRRVPAMELADTYRMELTVATHCAQNPDFREGVRALLIDKDNNPQWQYGSVDALPREYVLSHFEPPWAEHPLADLGA